MRVCEIFKSVQGEGINSGVVSVLVRLWGCNLHCDWCDEKKFRKKGCWQDLSQEEILNKLSKYNCSNIVITGGEPLIWPEITELT